jgi:hypothetical protein
MGGSGGALQAATGGRRAAAALGSRGPVARRRGERK